MVMVFLSRQESKMIPDAFPTLSRRNAVDIRHPLSGNSQVSRCFADAYFYKILGHFKIVVDIERLQCGNHFGSYAHASGIHIAIVAKHFHDNMVPRGSLTSQQLLDRHGVGQSTRAGYFKAILEACDFNINETRPIPMGQRIDQ